METGRILELKTNFEKIESIVNSINSPNKANCIKIVAVSKKKPFSDIVDLNRSGPTEFGENYAQELVEKFGALKRESDINFHFIGSLQSNKAQLVVGKVKLIHSLDRLSLVKSVNKAAKRLNIIQNVLIQINLTDEDTKSGIKEDQIEDFMKKMDSYPHIKVVGLMTMPFFDQDPEVVRPYFKKLREIKDNLNQKGYNLTELSMGMSNDFEVAIEEGATIIRIGTAIFGARVY